MMSYQTQRNLHEYYQSATDPRIMQDIEQLTVFVDTFVTQRSQRTDYLNDPTALKQAIDEYVHCEESILYGGKAGVYSILSKSIKSTDADIASLDSRITDKLTEYTNKLLFFPLSLYQTTESYRAICLSDDHLKPYHHWLKQMRRRAPHALSSQQEELLNLSYKPIYENRIDMTEEFLSTREITITYPDGTSKTKGFEEVMVDLSHPDVSTRQQAADKMNTIFEQYEPIATKELNSVLEYKKMTDTLRGLPRPDMERIMNDQLESGVVDALVQAVKDRYDISHRYYDLKAKLLKLPRLQYYERNLVYQTGEQVSQDINMDDAYELIKNVFAGVDTDFSEMYEQLWANGQVDALPKSGKRGGACCMWVSRTKPYVLLNFTNNKRELRTIAHEFGHAFHHLSMKDHHILDRHIGMFLAEYPSTFCEEFVSQQLMSQMSQTEQFDYRISRLNNLINTIHRQISCYQFERVIHDEYRSSGYLSTHKIQELFSSCMAQACGSAVDCSGSYGNWWIYWSHIRTYFYVYAYAGGLLIALSLHQLLANKAITMDNIKKSFAAGGSQSPQDIFAQMGLNISNPDFRRQGLDLIDQELRRCEQYAQDHHLV